MGTVQTPKAKEDLICRLDACVAHLYGLDEDDLAVIYETFHTGADHSKRHAAVLSHFQEAPQLRSGGVKRGASNRGKRPYWQRKDSQ